MEKLRRNHIETSVLNDLPIDLHLCLGNQPVIKDPISRDVHLSKPRQTEKKQNLYNLFKTMVFLMILSTYIN